MLKGGRARYPQNYHTNVEGNGAHKAMELEQRGSAEAKISAVVDALQDVGMVY